MRSEYIHLNLGEDIHAWAGHFTRDKEVRLEHNGREILYVVGGCTLESTCCGGSGRFAYALVPGYLVAWVNKTNKEGLSVSEVMPISDDETRKEVTRIIKEKESIRNIEFW